MRRNFKWVVIATRQDGCSSYYRCRSLAGALLSFTWLYFRQRDNSIDNITLTKEIEYHRHPNPVSIYALKEVKSDVLQDCG